MAGLVPVPVNGSPRPGYGSNGRHDEAEEPMKPKVHKRKPQPATLSMFEWALELEQQRETEPVRARC